MNDAAECSKTFTVILYIIYLCFIVQFLLIFVLFSHIISHFTVCLPIGCAARLICHSFGLILLNHLSIPHQSTGIEPFLVIVLMGACLLLTGISNFRNVSSATTGLLLITHHRPINILYINRNHYKTCSMTSYTLY